MTLDRVINSYSLSGTISHQNPSVNTTSSTYVDLGNSFTYMKKRDDTTLLVIVQVHSYDSAHNSAQHQFGVKVGSTDYNVAFDYANTIAHTRYTMGALEIVGVAKGSVTVQPRWHVGLGTANISAGLSLSVSVIECQPAVLSDDAVTFEPMGWVAAKASTGAKNMTGSTYADFGEGVTITKKSANTRLLCFFTGSCWTGAFTTRPLATFALDIDGTKTELACTAIDTNTEHNGIGGAVEIAGVSAGSHLCELYWKDAQAGGGALHTDTNDSFGLFIVEIP